jgi:hypothetical protein
MRDTRAGVAAVAVFVQVRTEPPARFITWTAAVLVWQLLVT